MPRHESYEIADALLVQASDTERMHYQTLENRRVEWLVLLAMSDGRCVAYATCETKREAQKEFDVAAALVRGGVAKECSGR